MNIRNVRAMNRGKFVERHGEAVIREDEERAIKEGIILTLTLFGLAAIAVSIEILFN